MEWALGAVTVIALVMTLAMGLVTWRLLREERRRGAARVAALEAELKRRGVPAAPTPTPSIGKTARTSAPFVDVQISHPGTAGHELFETASASSSGSRRITGIVVAAFLIAIAIGVAIVATLDTPAETETTRAATPQVELLALEHERQGSFLAISGSVRMSAGTPTPSPLAVMAMIYDDEGVIVASGRAPLDLGSSAHEETSFSVSLPADDASRYRVSFLSDDVTIPHVDRRPAGADGDPDAETTTARHDD